MWEDYFSVQIFFIILRETLESAIIVSVLLAFLKQNLAANSGATQTALVVDSKRYKGLQLQIWLGAFLGLFVCLVIGGIFIVTFYLLGSDLWSKAERLWEGIFSILSSVVISVMGLALLRINHLQAKWQWKLGRALRNGPEALEAEPDSEREVLQLSSGQVSGRKHRLKQLTREYALAILPFITTLREGLEAVVFIGGIGVNQPASSFPLAIAAGGSLGFLIGWTMYRGGNKMSLQYFLIASTCFLYMVAAGLMSRGVWFLELEQYVRRCNGQDMSEVGSGPGSYDISNSVWHVNCCNGLTDGGWMLFNALVGWTNSATWGSVISYNLYWIAIIVLLKVKRFEEKNGHLPVLPIRFQTARIRKRLMIQEMYLKDRTVGADNVPANDDAYNDLHSTLSEEQEHRETDMLIE
ncbi:unnamed protein product [Kuraishia capsulata CBS 1993]|uniref:Iron permease FTR1 n=1 Tax=Kuraishia capsulata CBS 1993 TaxID=1382522 RepID=W6MXH3_9ASCO|nr:uncharacterized protein KUCA_T00004875001 [Kuraishia capsulata CBS 1993]CDK28890.1 unnamed protein product [Kuraishia capsulata CBS 1993]